MTNDTKTDYHAFLETFALFTRVAHELASLESDADKELHELIERHEEDWRHYSATRKAAHDALVDHITAHPEWLNGKKSLVTVHGTIASRAATGLQIPNETRTLALIKELHPGAFIRTEEHPDREALERLTDEELLALEILRDRRVTWTAKPAAVKFGEAKTDTKTEGEK